MSDERTNGRTDERTDSSRLGNRRRPVRRPHGPSSPSASARRPAPPARVRPAWFLRVVIDWRRRLRKTEKKEVENRKRTGRQDQRQDEEPTAHERKVHHTVELRVSSRRDEVHSRNTFSAFVKHGHGPLRNERTSERRGGWCSRREPIKHACSCRPGCGRGWRNGSCLFALFAPSQHVGTAAAAAKEPFIDE